MNTTEHTYKAHIFLANNVTQVAQEVQNFRKRLFIDTLGWCLVPQEQLEIDEFDHQYAVYATLRRNNEIVGSFRAIRADRPYLAENVFPELAVTRPYPKTANCYEISRFGVWPDKTANESAGKLYALMFHFALFRRLKSLIAVTDLFHERYLLQKKIRTRRFGVPQLFHPQLDARGFKLVAGEIPIAKQEEVYLQALLANLNGVTIHDDTLVFGRQSVSA